jgi:bacterioferritin-associated ferredoxin
MHDDSTTPRPPAEPPAPSGDSDDEALQDREVCLCFHVPLRKLLRHLRLNSAQVASQLSECYGAGTGCGWCIPHLEHLHEQFHRGEAPRLSMTPEEYARRRKVWKQSKRRDWIPFDAIASPMTSPPNSQVLPGDSPPDSPSSRALTDPDFPADPPENSIR